MMTTTRRRARRPLALDRLDPRIVPAAVIGGLATPVDAPTSPILALDPAPGSTLSASPTAITATFPQALDPSSLTLADLRVDRVGPDGTGTPAIDPGDPPVESLDGTGTQLSVQLAKPLATGRYRVVLDANSFLFYLDGTPVPTTGADITLGEFTVRRPGAKLGDAVDLGPVPTGAGASPMVIPGTLNLKADDQAVKLYRVTVPAGHLWRLGPEVDAQARGSSLDAALSLLDRTGRVLATDDMGLASTPADPFLFQDVGPGTYYVGVSGAGNLAGQPGGYDPSAGIPGTAGRPQGAGGAYTLRVVADPADAPTVASGVVVHAADPGDPTPTSLTLSFSGPIREDLGGPGQPGVDSTLGVRLLDDYGRSWPIETGAIDAGGGRIDYVLRDRLPAGHYTLRPTAAWPQLDLGGRPVQGTGADANILASFTVAPDAPSPLNDLGPLFPDDLPTGTARDLAVNPGQSVDLRATVLYGDLYKLAVSTPGGSLTATLLDGRGNVVGPIAVQPSGRSGYQLQSLNVGQYTLRLTAGVGGGPVFAHVSIRAAGTWPEKLLDNGLGQGGALGLRLAAPDSQVGSHGSTPDAASPTIGRSESPAGPGGSTAVPSSPAAAFAAASIALAPSAPAPTPSAGPSGFGGGASAQVPGVFLALAGEPVGRPSLPALAATPAPSAAEGVAAASSLGQSVTLPSNPGGFGYATAPTPPEVVPPADAPAADALAGTRLAEPVPVGRRRRGPRAGESASRRSWPLWSAGARRGT